MADYSLMPPAAFSQGLLNSLPGLKLPQIIQIYQAAKDAGGDQMDPTQLAAIGGEIAKKMADQSSQSIPTTDLGTVTVTGKREVSPSDGTLLAQLGLAPVPTGVAAADPYVGSSQEAANPSNPQAVAQSQFDPAQLQAAQAKQSQYYQDTLPYRQAANTIAGMGAAYSGNNNGAQAIADLWKNRDTQAQQETLGLQKALQEQATQGTANATAQQGIAKGVQGVAQEAQKTAAGALGLQLEQQRNTPGSNVSLLAAQALADQYKMAGQNLPKNLDISTLTARQAEGYMIPAVLDAYKKKIDAVVQQATGGKIGAETQGLQLGNRILNTATEGGTKVPQGMNLSVNVGGASLSPNSQVTTQQTGAGVNAVQTENQIKNWNTLVQPTVDTTMKKISNTYTGKGAQAWSAWIPGDNAQTEMAQRFAQINQIYPEALPPEVAANIKAQQSKPGFNGSIQLPLSPQQALTGLSQAKANVARIEADRAARLDWQKNGGDPIEYSQSNQAQKIAKSRVAINPNTFQTTLIDPNNPQDLAKMKSQGLVDADNFRVGQ